MADITKKYESKEQNRVISSPGTTTTFSFSVDKTSQLPTSVTLNFSLGFLRGIYEGEAPSMLTNIYVSVDGATKVLAEQGVEFKAGEDTVKKVSFELDYVDAKIKKPFSTIKFFIYQNFNVDWLNYVIYPATLTYTVNGTKSITSMYPSGETIPRSSVNSFTWKTTTPGVITSNKLYYKKTNKAFLCSTT